MILAYMRVWGGNVLILDGTPTDVVFYEGLMVSLVISLSIFLLLDILINTSYYILYLFKKNNGKTIDEESIGGADDE